MLILNQNPNTGIKKEHLFCLKLPIFSLKPLFEYHEDRQNGLKLLCERKAVCLNMHKDAKMVLKTKMI